MNAIVSPGRVALGVFASATFLVCAARSAVVTPRLHDAELKAVADRVHALAVQVRARALVVEDTGRGFRVGDAVSSGSGVLIGDGLAITELSAVTLDTRDGLLPANEIEVVIDDVGTVPARLVAGDAGLDIAVLQLPVAARSLPGAVMADDTPSVGDAVLAIGVDGDSIRADAMLVERIDGKGETGARLLTDRALPPFYCGGPLFDLGGRLLGIATHPAGTGESGVPASVLRALVQKALATGGSDHGRVKQP